MKHRRPKVVWLTPDPYNRVQQGGQGGPIGDVANPIIGKYSFQAPVSGPGVYTGLAAAVVGDKGLEDNSIIGIDDSSKTFSDMYNSGYRLRRVVGQCGPTLQQLDTADVLQPTNYLFTAALQVMRVTSAGVPANGEQAAPDTYQGAENPWIWRRSWLLTNYPQSQQTGETTLGIITAWNGGLSIREGTFIDQKTVRIVSQDERLFWCLQCTSLDGSAAGAGPGVTASFFTNVRVLASLKQNVGNRGNSAR